MLSLTVVAVQSLSNNICSDVFAKAGWCWLLQQKLNIVYLSVQTPVESNGLWLFLSCQCHPMVWLCTVAPLWQRKARRRKSISTLSLLSQSTPPCTSATTSSTPRWELSLGSYCICFSCREDSWDPVLRFLSHSHNPFFPNSLQTQALTALLSDDSKFGFIVIDGSGALFGTLQGNTREVLHKFTVDLPKKHGTCPQLAQYRTFDISAAQQAILRELITLYYIVKHSKDCVSLSLFQAEEGSLLYVLPVWEWRRDTTMWEKWLRRLSSSLCPTTKLMWLEWSWLALPTSRQSSASLTCLTQ